MSYHNTVNEKGSTLDQYKKQTATQDNRIACHFEANPGEEFTPWEIQSLVFHYGESVPITSVRRSMSDLTKAHVLTKTEHKKEVGAYGRRSYAWTLNEKYKETVELMVFSDKDEVQAVLDELDKDLARQDAPDAIAGAITLSPKKIGDLPCPSHIAPQGKLFDVPPIKEPPVHCAICNRELTNPYSIKLGVGPICHGKCLADVLKKEKYGL